MIDSSEAPLPDEGLTLDLAVVRSLARLTGGDIATFQHTSEPPDEVIRWLADADRSGVNGALIHAVRRWCELCREQGGD